MKVHLHRFFKYCTTLLVLLLLVTNCERDTHFETPQLEDNLKVRIVNSDEVPDLFNKLKKDAKFYSSKGDNQNLDLDLDKIIEVTDSTNHKNYSFNFKSVSTGKYFANVVVPQDSIGNFGTPLVYKYIPDDAFVESYRAGDLEFTDFYGTIEVYDFYEYVNAQEQDKASYNSAPPGIAPCITAPVGPNGTEGSEGGPFSGSNICWVSQTTVTCWCQNEAGVGFHEDHIEPVTTYTVICTEDGSGDSDVDDVYQKSSYNPTGCGGGNNNNTNPIGINQPKVVPCLDDSNCYVDYINNVLSKLPNLTQQQADWIADFDNIQKVVQLSDFLDENDSPEAVNFAKAALNTLMVDGEVDFDERLIYNSNLDNDYRNKMAEKEKEIFDELSNYQKSQYLMSAQQAWNYAEIYHPNTLHNGKGDALRHAFWNALCTVRLGDALTKELTTAHESDPLDPNYIFHYKESEMDLFNNEQGRQIAYGSGKLYQLIENALSNGELKYLKPLGASINGQYCQTCANSNSTLTSTNN